MSTTESSQVQMCTIQNSVLVSQERSFLRRLVHVSYHLQWKWSSVQNTQTLLEELSAYFWTFSWFELNGWKHISFGNTYSRMLSRRIGSRLYLCPFHLWWHFELWVLLFVLLLRCSNIFSCDISVVFLMHWWLKVFCFASKRLLSKLWCLWN